VLGAVSIAALSRGDADAARRAAAQILGESRFHSSSVPRPLHGVLHAVGDAASAVGRWVVHAVERVGRLVPGGTVTVWVVLGLALIVTVVLIARRASRRALLRQSGVADARGRLAVERAAEAAERDGRYADAVRLRFRAGLAHLGERGAVRRPRSTPTLELARTLRSEDFDALAHRFDEIVYGAAPAAADDAEEARRRWATVLGGSERR
jgi:hypothetical protein